MISIIITTYKEPQSLPQAIEAFLNQNFPEDYEILIVGPDKATAGIAQGFFKKYPQVKYLEDQGRGKPAALNMAFKKAQGKILVLSDGDVWIGEGSLEKVLEPLKDGSVWAVSGRPISINSREEMFGYWSHFLTEAAHEMRLTSKNFPCSGYLYALRRDLISKIPEDILSEDAFITQIIRNKDYKVVYVPGAQVYVKYPDNFRDWLKQKVRSTGGYQQKLLKFPPARPAREADPPSAEKMRGLWQEIRGGVKLFFTYPKNLKEFWWTILLYFARIYLWLAIFWNIKIRKKKFADIWQPVESTK